MDTNGGLPMGIGTAIRQHRKHQGLTLREVAERAGVDFTYLSKIENEKPGFEPGADTIRALATALDVDELELLEMADKAPPELATIARHASGRRFLRRAREIASPDDWDALLDVLEARDRERRRRE